MHLSPHLSWLARLSSTLLDAVSTAFAKHFNYGVNHRMPCGMHVWPMQLPPPPPHTPGGSSFSEALPGCFVGRFCRPIQLERSRRHFAHLSSPLGTPDTHSRAEPKSHQQAQAHQQIAERTALLHHHADRKKCKKLQSVPEQRRSYRGATEELNSM
jgi:hypothetical protein